MKMKSVVIIFLLMVLQASIGFGQSSVSNQADQWSRSFKKNIPNTVELEAYEEKCIQKLKDFVDYLDIIRNPAYDSLMRKQAVSQATGSFVSENNKVDFTGKEMNLKTLLDAVYLDKNKKLSFSVSDIKIKDHFHLKGNGYRGKLTFKVLKNGKLAEKTIVISLVKIEKHFGNDDDIVWTVFLGGEE
jgi:hypothetical protein